MRFTRLAGILTGLTALTLASAQAPPPQAPPIGGGQALPAPQRSPIGGGEALPLPQRPPIGAEQAPMPQIPPIGAGQPPPIQQVSPHLGRELPLHGCVAPDGKLLAIDMNINLVARATSPFSIELTWSGPPIQYQVTTPWGKVAAMLTTPPTTLALPEPSTGVGRVTLASAQAAEQATIVSGTFSYGRPQFPVLPDSDYGFKVEATLPDGKPVCATAGTKTLPAPLTALASQFVAPDDIRVGFVLPPFAQEINVYRKTYVEDGRRPPFDKQVFQELLQSPHASPVAFEVRRGGVRGGVIDSRKRINPGLPPLPAAYNQPIAYQLVVEAVWRDGATRTSRTQIPIRVDGPVPLSGWADLHTHPMSHLAFGGKVFHGAPDLGSLLPALSVPGNGPAPWSCIVQPNLRATSITQALADDSPTHGDPVQSYCGDAIRKLMIVGMEAGNGVPQPGRRSGAPVFDAWPSWNDTTHQKMWIDWIRRAYDGGLRVLVALSHNNRLLASIARGNCNDPQKPCLLPIDDRTSSDLQIEEIKSFVGRHSDFMEVALSPADVYRIVRGNPPQVPAKIAIVLGIEIDNIGNIAPGSAPSREAITGELTRLYNQGVRYIFPVHVSDSVFGGTAPYNQLFNAANVFETGRFWDVECAGTAPFADDNIGFRTPNVTALQDLQSVLPHPFNSLVPANVELPKSPQNCPPGAGHRNRKGLNTTQLANPPQGGFPGIGEFGLREMMRLGMIIDIDHMSHRTAEQVLALAESIPGGGYPLMSGHSGIRDRNTPFHAENSRTRAQLGRIGCLGGMFGLGTDHAKSLDWARQYLEASTVIGQRNPACLYKEIGRGAVALGTDTNSMVKGPAPSGRNIYGLTKNGATRFPHGPSTEGGGRWDYANLGVAHYGMYADFIKDVWSFDANPAAGLNISGQELVDNHLARNADNFWRMWVKAEQLKNNAWAR